MASAWIFLQCIVVVLGQGLDFEPKLEENESDLIWFSTSKPETYSKYIDRLEGVLKSYKEEANSVGRFVDCADGVYPDQGQICRIQFNYWHPCTASYEYGYVRGQPCVILKFARIDNWTPKYYNYSSVPSSMPKYLKYHIRMKYQSLEPNDKMIWLSCEGESPADIEHIGGIQFYPTLGFSGAFFAVEKKDDFVSPLVAAVFENPTRGVVLNVICKAYAPNLDESLATIRFSILVD